MNAAHVQRFSIGTESPLKGVSSSAWQRFLAVLEVQGLKAISESGGLGSFDIRPRRLMELGYVTSLRSERTPMHRQVYVCDFILPWTQTRFLADTFAQYTALTQSMKLYYDALLNGRLKRPEGVTFSGALAILHRGGRGALEAWPELFDETRALYERARGIF